MFNNHLMKVCLAAVFAIGLAACSSSDNGTDTSMPTPTDPPPPTQAEQDLEELRNQIAALREQLGIDDDDDIGATVKELQDTLKELQDAAAKMASDAAIAAAVALFNGIGESTTDLTVAVTAVADEDGGGGMASVTATGLTPGVGGDDVMKSAEAMLGDWQGTMLTDAIADDADTNPGARSTVVVYTDIEAAKGVPFGDVYTLDGAGNLAIDADSDADAHVKLISASAFTHTGRMVHDPDEDDTSETIRIRGMFNGAAGEFRCAEGGTAGACASIESSEGVRLVGTWVFDPDSSAMAMMADASYAYFGWWLNRGTTEGAEAGVFHGVTDGSTPASLAAPTAANFTPLGGTATYTGAAAGQYAINPGLSAAHSGSWTADATLTADFGSETADGTISGMIEDFMSGDMSMDWSVALGETQLSDTGVFDTATDTDAANGTNTNAVVWTIGGVDGAEAGAWSGALRAAGDNNVPTVATGMFSTTHGTVGHIMGAFGVDLE